MSVEERLAALRADYKVALPGKLAELGRALGDPARLAEARALAHRLRGTAATYGFSAVSAACATIERLLDEGDGPAAGRAYAAFMQGEGGSPSTGPRSDP